jgi:DNA-directed RNA polymerase specialized sigma24 family protein
MPVKDFDPKSVDQYFRQEVTRLHNIAAVPQIKAADICGCPIGTAKSRVFRARRALQMILDGDAFGRLHTPT